VHLMSDADLRELLESGHDFVVTSAKRRPRA
jgi:hypothetical protein